MPNPFEPESIAAEGSSWGGSGVREGSCSCTRESGSNRESRASSHWNRGRNRNGLFGWTEARYRSAREIWSRRSGL